MKRLQGHLNSPLTEQGKRQAAALADAITELNIAKIIHSPLGRAADTAQLCAQTLSLPTQSYSQLVERHFGDWQGAYFDDLKQHPSFSDVFLDCTEQAPPKGESGFACAERLKQALITIAENHPGQTLLVITHGDVIRCLMSRLGVPAKVDAYSRFGNGRVFPLRYDHQSQQLEAQ